MDLLETAATEAEAISIPEPQDATFATIDEIFDDGVTLIFDGQETATEKHYKVNSFAIFKAKDRVRIIKDSGTYVVEYTVGVPKKTFNADSAKTADSATNAESATTAKALIDAASSGSKVYLKISSSWLYFGASASHLTAIPKLPGGGTSGQCLIKDSATDYAASWGTPSVTQLYYNSTDYVTLNSSRQLVPHAHSSTYKYSLGSSSYPWADLYIGRGVIQLGNNASYNTIGFFGATPTSRKTISTASNNMGYSSATESNYLKVLNNLVGALKTYGLISV